MQITVNRTDLHSAVTWAKRGIARRPLVPVLAAMRVTIGAGRLTLEAFDYDVATRAHAFGDDLPGEPVTVLVCGAQLADAVKAMPAGKTTRVTITSADDGGLTVASGPVSCHVPPQLGDHDEYPALPEMPAAAGIIAGDEFRAAIARVTAAAGTDDTLPVLTCVAFELGDSLVMAATDRYRLASETVSWSPAAIGAEQQTAYVPARMLAEFAKAAKGAGKVTVFYEVPDAPANERGFGGISTRTGFATEERELIIRTSDGSFPSWRKLMPTGNQPTVITADAAALLAAVKRAGSVCGRADRLDVIAGETLTLEPQRDGEAAGSETVAAQITGDAVTVAFNPGYLASLLAGVTGPVRIGIDGKKPAYITAPAVPDFAALICAIRRGDQAS
jgi:DNA polymerase-3 subunit beta